MRQAIRLARRGVGRTSPNPPVGAVVVKNGRVVGRGLHRRAGEVHAEVAALRAAGPRARGAVLYVTLEPCTHHGRTPPCSDAVRAAGCRRVVVGARDPNPRVSGRGVERLRRAGITVDVGVEGAACAELVAPFAKHARTGLPLVTLKLAASLDGRIATVKGDSRWISGEAARRLVHGLRNEMDAVMVGSGTVLADDPRLTCRVRGGRDPLRVIVDGRLEVPLSARVLAGKAAAGTVVATTSRDARKIAALRAQGVEVVVLPGGDGHVPLRRLLRRLGERGVLSIMIEGGSTLAAAALRTRVVDRLLFFYAAKLIGGDGRPMLGSLGVTAIARCRKARELRVRRVGRDVLVSAVL